MKASVPRIKRKRNPKGKTVRWTVLSESVDQACDWRCRSEGEAANHRQIKPTSLRPKCGYDRTQPAAGFISCGCFD